MSSQIKRAVIRKIDKANKPIRNNSLPPLDWKNPAVAQAEQEFTFAILNSIITSLLNQYKSIYFNERLIKEGITAEYTYCRLHRKVRKYQTEIVRAYTNYERAKARKDITAEELEALRLKQESTVSDLYVYIEDYYRLAKPPVEKTEVQNALKENAKRQKQIESLIEELDENLKYYLLNEKYSTDYLVKKTKEVAYKSANARKNILEKIALAKKELERYERIPLGDLFETTLKERGYKND